MKKAAFLNGLACTLLTLALAGLPGCGKKGNSIVQPGDDTSVEHWWDNFLDAAGNPITLFSGFQLAKISGTLKDVTPTTSSTQGMVLSFAVEYTYRSNQGYIFRGNNQGNSNLENLAGAVEFVKQSGYLRHRETFDWEGLRETPPGSFNFTRINRFVQPSIRSTFNGFASDLMLILLSSPYIVYPADTTRHWAGQPVYVSNGSGNEFVEVFGYQTHFIGKVNLKEDLSTIGTFNDVIMVEGIASDGQGHIQAYLAPNIGIIYYKLTTAFGQLAAGALIGYSGSNYDLDGNGITDYMPLAPGNQWLYEFSPDDHVPQFRFKVETLLTPPGNS